MGVKQLVTMPLKTFFWDRDKQELTADASDFGSVAEGTWWLQQLYDDACDIGIAIESPTGKVELFTLADEVKDGEGDLMYWEFSPVNPKCRVKTVRIFND